MNKVEISSRIDETPTFVTKEIKTEFIIGDVHYYTAKKFNWFNRLMMKLVFGWEVTIV